MPGMLMIVAFGRVAATEKQWAYENNSELLEGEFPDETAFQKVPYYICESCRFVSSDKAEFNIDHVHPIAEGGRGIASAKT
jgi:hypothetical protein